jgi:hypothetical protein
LKVHFLKPAGFDEAYNALVAVLHDDAGAMRMYYPLLIDGASGCGKTRMAVELYRKILKEAESMKLTKVAYAFVDMDIVDRAGSADDACKSVLKVLMRSYTHGLRDLDAFAKWLGSLTLEDLMSSLFPGDGRVALYLHVDEFQKNEKTMAFLLKAVKAYNGNQPSRPILLVGSGLYTNHRQLDLQSSSERYVFELRYFDNALAYRLVREGAHAFVTPDGQEELPHFLCKLLPERDTDAPLLVRFLTEDTGGWALACVQLGVELAMSNAAEPNMLEMGLVETRVLDRLTFLYKQDILLSMSGLSSVGQAKLMLLALSPLSVSCHDRTHFSRRPSPPRSESRCPFALSPMLKLLQASMFFAR